jgi:hypothetical protein
MACQNMLLFIEKHASFTPQKMLHIRAVEHLFRYNGVSF